MPAARLQHLWAAALAIAVLAVCLAAVQALAHHQAELKIHTIAASPDALDDVAYISTAWQQAALRQPDLLPIYGSSEISLGGLARKYQAAAVFRTYPTGFAPFQVAGPAVNSLLMAQEIAALGDAAKDRKIVISFTPAGFFDKQLHPSNYGKLFRPLYGYALIFGPGLRWETRQAAAQRMLGYAEFMAGEPVLMFALERLAGGTPLDRALYYAAWPLGRLRLLQLQLADSAYGLGALAQHGDLPPAPEHKPLTIDWAKMLAKAEKATLSDTDNNPYGFDNTLWNQYFGATPPEKLVKTTEAKSLRNLNKSAEWRDLEVLLGVLHELGAKPLLLSRPMNGPFWEAMGRPANVRNEFYDRLEAMAAKYDVPLVSFREHDGDKYFAMDALSHTSRTGWVYVNQVLDNFYHDRLR